MGSCLVAGTIVGASFLAVTPLSGQINALAVTIAGDVVCNGCVGINGDGTNDIKDASVTNPKIAPDAISTSKIGPGAVTNGDIGSGAVTTSKLAANAVTSGKIASNSVTLSKMALNSINTTQILDGAVTPAKLVPNGRITYTNYVGYVFTATPTNHVATGVSYPIEAGLWKKVRFFIWQGGVSDDNKITLELWAGSVGLTPNPNNSAYFQSTTSGVDPSTSGSFTKLASIKIKKINAELFSPPTANELSLNIIGDGVATFQPQEQGYELTQESSPEGWR